MNGNTAAFGTATPNHLTEDSQSLVKKTLPDLPPLTGLRFFAAFFILVGHGTIIFFKFNPSPQLALNVATCFLEIGMELFFVLSGFVIHYNYADVSQHSQNLAKFYVARFARIYPLYVFFLTLQFALYWEVKFLPAIPFYLAMTQSWVFILFGHDPLFAMVGSAQLSWSISTEWFFYCLYPLVAWFLAVSRNRLEAALVVTAWALLGLVTAVALYLHAQTVTAFAQAVWGPYATDPFYRWLIGFSPVGRLPPFLIGIATAHIFITGCGTPVSKSEGRIGTVLLTLAIISVIVMCYFQSLGNAYYQSAALFVYPLSISVIIFCCARYRSLYSGFLSLPLIVLCGEASYSLYLFHYSFILSVFGVSELALTWNNITSVIVRLSAVALMAIVFSIALYRLIEVPARSKIRARFARFAAPGASLTLNCVPVVICVGIPLTLAIIGWIISLR